MKSNAKYKVTGECQDQVRGQMEMRNWDDEKHSTKDTGEKKDAN